MEVRGMRSLRTRNGSTVTLAVLVCAASACAEAHPPDDVEAVGRGSAALTLAVDPQRELLITDLSVIEDPPRTTYTPNSAGSAGV
jgi:hypothetical protein